MPFVARKVEPRLLCRGHVPPGPSSGAAGAELDSVAHGALTSCLKQLACVLTLAEDIFAELTSELTTIADRSGALRLRVDKVDECLATIDPKKVPVPESDISTFASRKDHYHGRNDVKAKLFTADTRPKILRELYEAAAVVAVRSLDSISRDGRNNSTDMYLCTPVLGKKRVDQSLEIESRVPAAIEDLRRWTSTEALGDVTVPPDCMSRILTDATDDDAVDHKLPSPEEQVQAVALRFPAEVVAVDVSGRGFERMSIRRRSLLSPAGQESNEVAVKRRSRPRRPRGKRRNTIAGIDHKEIRQAIGGETATEGLEEEEASPVASSRAHRSASTDLLGSKKESPSEKKSHFNTLKAWGMSRLKLISPKSSQNVQDSGVGGGSSRSEEHDQSAEEKQSGSPEEVNIYETVTMRRRKEKFHERKPSSSSSSGKSTSSIPVSAPPVERQANVKLRESAAQRRERRKGNREDAPHSSSGNWSASSESGRASIGSETTTTTHPPRYRSTTTASIGTSSTSLSHVRRPKGRDTSASSSVTSEGTLTPDIIHDITAVPFSDDGENSSVYSCDTEGYYTSFHVDSGLKTLREEESLPQSPLTKSCDLSPELASPVAENEYELFGRGSTSTTTSSAGTVCTTLLAPPPPERKSSLTVVAMVHGQNQNGGQSPDSGHNTSSSPVESASSPACTGRSCSEFEYSESSDLEGCERVERIRSKTAINVSRIPSMCVITPPGSDDETSKDGEAFRGRMELGSVLMSATVGTSKMEVINGQDKNPYATVQTVLPHEKAGENSCRRISQSSHNPAAGSSKVSPLSGVLGKLRCVLPGGGKKTSAATTKTGTAAQPDPANPDSGDYVTIADVRNNNNKRSDHSSTLVRAPQPAVTYANADLFKKDAEYVSLSDLPRKQDSSLERRRQGARVTLDSEGKVVYSSDSLKRRKGAHTTFNPGPFVKEGVSPTTSPLLHRAQATVRAVNRDLSIRGRETTDCPESSTPPMSPQLGKLIIRAPKSPERAASPNYVRTPSTVVGPTSPTSPQKHLRGAYVNVQGEEDSALLAASKETVAQDGLSKKPTAPPYIDPPQLKDRAENLQSDPRRQPSNVKQNVCLNDRADRTTRKIEAPDQEKLSNYANDNRSNYKENQNRVPKQSAYFDRENNKRNSDRFCDGNGNGNANGNGKQFYTLPNSRTSPRELIEPPRSVTPDITRGLARGPLSAMHMMARRGQNISASAERPSRPSGHGLDSDGHIANNDVGKTQNQRQEQKASIPRNRFIVPASLAAVGYRFIAAPPVQNPPSHQGWKSPGTGDPLRQAGLSPIGPGGNRGFQSSTPGGGESKTGAQSTQHHSRLAPPVQNSSGRNTPANLVLSPTRSTMSNEELFAMIHKSKRRLNIKEEPDLRLFGDPGAASSHNQANSRHSWSPESQEIPVVPKSVNPISSTSRRDFKRLLLQQSVKAGPTRLSAAEQLKLSRQQTQQQQQQLLHQQRQQQQLQSPPPPVKVLSPRAAWRFPSPRSDVLSSTIIEDAAAEEKAMKPSPENPSPMSRPVSKRQLDLGGPGPKIDSIIAPTTNVPNSSINAANFSTPKKRPLISAEGSAGRFEEIKNSSQIPSSVTVLPGLKDLHGIAESRRINNQLARAQFLASFPATVTPSWTTSQNQTSANYFTRHNRARSESPQHGVVQNVSRSPSAPTLETAL
ncbi:uncharacterized protein LOC124302922 isoform X1 [Neodiprion virginianus]|uniref:uncharacterized protein LOC124302922 isoform X1 n=1 Tax=Neodiprion virginianus TaxID=2961670 RepID=UPI001EE6B060|nr:uncharacterized protein LOC124302922 isoform X1 [Neodiprion virginianus]